MSVCFVRHSRVSSVLGRRFPPGTRLGEPPRAGGAELPRSLGGCEMGISHRRAMESRPARRPGATCLMACEAQAATFRPVRGLTATLWCRVAPASRRQTGQCDGVPVRVAGLPRLPVDRYGRLFSARMALLVRSLEPRSCFRYPKYSRATSENNGVYHLGKSPRDKGLSQSLGFVRGERHMVHEG